MTIEWKLFSIGLTLVIGAVAATSIKLAAVALGWALILIAVVRWFNQAIK